MQYINRELALLDARKNQLIQGHQEVRKKHSTQPRRVIFCQLDFEEKKLVAAQFIHKILLSQDHVEVVWAV